MQMRKVRATLGVIYLVAGFGKCFPQVESTEERLRDALEANRGTQIESPTEWLFAHHEEINTLVSAAMVGQGTALLSNDHRLGSLAALSTLPMLATFVVVLSRSQPAVRLVDAAFAAVGVWIVAKGE